MSESAPDEPKRFEARTPGFDEGARTPETPSERAEWNKSRHADALEYHKKQNARPGMDDAPARRNQYCPKCKGVVDWQSEICPHCKTTIPVELRDYYNFSDFEPPVDRRELLPVITAFAIVASILGLVIWGLVALVRWMIAG
ncbi:MAG: hypothetical protein HY286_03795 [Planctomycetes bacterium]|nr:hypothetical protein [Planctomycetota bacterium]